MILDTVEEIKPSHRFGVHNSFTDGWELYPGVEQASFKKMAQIWVSLASSV